MVFQSLFNSVIPFILELGLLIFVHELGHFLAAKRFGMRVYEFALGMGPALFRWKGGETIYSLRVLPIGGFVRIAGIEPNEDPDVPGSFNQKPLYQRFITILAGCLMNFFLAVILFCIIGLGFGVETPTPIHRVREVLIGYPAVRAGIRPGDELVGIGGRGRLKVQEIRSEIEKHPGKPLVLLVQRENRLLQITVVPKAEKDARTGRVVGRIGVAFDNLRRKVGILESVLLGFHRTWLTTYGLLYGLWQTLTGQVPGGVGGPVMIGRMTAQAFQRGWETFLDFVAMISVNLAILNLIPFPGLDGSRLLFLTVEAIRGRKVDPRKEAYVHFVGLMILIALMFVITYNDILRWLHEMSRR